MKKIYITKESKNKCGEKINWGKNQASPTVSNGAKK